MACLTKGDPFLDQIYNTEVSLKKSSAFRYDERVFFFLCKLFWHQTVAFWRPNAKIRVCLKFNFFLLNFSNISAAKSSVTFCGLTSQNKYRQHSCTNRTWSNEYKIRQHPQMLHQKFDHFQTWVNDTQHVPTWRNRAVCCVEMLRSFGRGFWISYTNYLAQTNVKFNCTCIFYTKF